MPDVSSKVPLPGMVSACERAGTHARASTEPSGVSEPVQGERNEKKSLLSFFLFLLSAVTLEASEPCQPGEKASLSMCVVLGKASEAAPQSEVSLTLSLSPLPSGLRQGQSPPPSLSSRSFFFSFVR